MVKVNAFRQLPLPPPPTLNTPPLTMAIPTTQTPVPNRSMPNSHRMNDSQPWRVISNRTLLLLVIYVCTFGSDITLSFLGAVGVHSIPVELEILASWLTKLKPILDCLVIYYTPSVRREREARLALAHRRIGPLPIDNNAGLPMAGAAATGELGMSRQLQQLGIKIVPPQNGDGIMITDSPATIPATSSLPPLIGHTLGTAWSNSTNSHSPPSNDTHQFDAHHLAVLHPPLSSMPSIGSPSQPLHHHDSYPTTGGMATTVPAMKAANIVTLPFPSIIDGRCRRCVR
jgi:hypothetical protein